MTLHCSSAAVADKQRAVMELDAARAETECKRESWVNLKV